MLSLCLELQATVQRKRESMELMQSSRSLRSDNPDSSVAKLLREKLSIAASMRSINEVISQAFEAKSTLSSQRTSLSNSTGGLSTLGSSMPGIGRLIDGIQKKKFRESLVVALVVAVLLCFTVW
jgi:Golgi SNAP receptor complex protein 1